MTFEEILEEIHKHTESFTTQFVKIKCKEHSINVGKSGTSIEKRLIDLGYMKTQITWHKPGVKVHQTGVMEYR